MAEQLDPTEAIRAALTHDVLYVATLGEDGIVNYDEARAVLVAALQPLADRLRAAEERLTECAEYLNDGETPAECIDRNRRDIDAVLGLLVVEKRKTDALRDYANDSLTGGEGSEVAHIVGAILGMWEPQTPRAKWFTDKASAALAAPQEPRP